MVEKQTNLKQKKAEDDEYETVPDETFFRFENIGDTIQGILSDKGRSERYGVGMYTIDTKDGSTRILGKTHLDRLMNKVEIGDYILITYLDNQETPKGEMKIFEVKRKTA